jgi:hypothetical protein
MSTGDWIIMGLLVVGFFVWMMMDDDGDYGNSLE